MTDYNPRASAVRETLRKHLPDMDAATRGRVVRVLVTNNHAVDDIGPTDHLYAASGERNPLSPLQASAAQPRRFAEVTGLCRQLGFHISASDTKLIDTIALDKAFAGRDLGERMRAKTALYQLGLIAA